MRSFWLFIFGADGTRFFWLLIFGAEGFAFALAAYKFTHKQSFTGVFLTLIGLSALAMSIWCLRSTAQFNPPLDPLESDRIVMQASSGAMSTTLLWALGFIAGAISFAVNPEVMGIRWLGYPAVPILLALAGIVLVGARGEKVTRYIADAYGFEERSGLPGPQLSDEEDKAEEYRTKIAWSEVGAVKRIELRTRGSSGGRVYRSERTLQRRLVFFDHKGKELMFVDDGLDPPERYELFLKSIPRWTGLEVKQERHY